MRINRVSTVEVPALDGPRNPLTIERSRRRPGSNRASVNTDMSTGGADYDGRKVAEARQLVATAMRAYPELASEKSGFLERQLAGINFQQAEKELQKVSGLGLRLLADPKVLSALQSPELHNRPIVLEGWLRVREGVLRVRSAHALAYAEPASLSGAGLPARRGQGSPDRR